MELVDHWAASAVIFCQLAPPSVVRRIVPAHPTAQPCCPSRKNRPSMACEVFVFCAFHVRPPSVVAINVPFIPEAQPLSPTNVTSISFSFVPESRGVHFCPPSSVP